jgi:dolichol-phosphate mannosyltransferase
MADLSDDPHDAVAYYRKIEEGYDCVFGSRFMPGAKVENYPTVKLFFNRIVNRAIQWLFWTPFNDLTNAFKAYRTLQYHH